MNELTKFQVPGFYRPVLPTEHKVDHQFYHLVGKKIIVDFSCADEADQFYPDNLVEVKFKVQAFDNPADGTYFVPYKNIELTREDRAILDRYFQDASERLKKKLAAQNQD